MSTRLSMSPSPVYIPIPASPIAKTSSAEAKKSKAANTSNNANNKNSVLISIPLSPIDLVSPVKSSADDLSTYSRTRGRSAVKASPAPTPTKKQEKIDVKRQQQLHAIEEKLKQQLQQHPPAQKQQAQSPLPQNSTVPTSATDLKSPNKQRTRRQPAKKQTNQQAAVSPNHHSIIFESNTPLSLSPVSHLVNPFIDSPEFGAKQQLAPSPFSNSVNQDFIGYPKQNPNSTTNESSSTFSLGAQQNNSMFTSNPDDLLNNAVLLSSLFAQVKPNDISLTSLFEQFLPQSHLQQQKPNANNNNNLHNNNNINNNLNSDVASQRKLNFDEQEMPNGFNRFQSNRQQQSSFQNSRPMDLSSSVLSNITTNALNCKQESFSSGFKQPVQQMQFDANQQQSSSLQQSHSVVIPSPKRAPIKNLAISSNSSFRAGPSQSSCPIHNMLKNKILPFLESKIRNQRGGVVSGENEKDMWLCEIVECVRQLKSIPVDQIYHGEYSMLLEQVYDALLTISEQTSRNFQYVLNMITRTMTDIDKKIIKYLHDYSRLRGEKYSHTREIIQSRTQAMINAIKIEDENTDPVRQQQPETQVMSPQKSSNGPRVKVMYESIQKESFARQRTTESASVGANNSSTDLSSRDQLDGDIRYQQQGSITTAYVGNSGNGAVEKPKGGVKME